MGYSKPCPFCGTEFDRDDGHDCSETPAVSQADGCPMCGEEYDDYLAHLKQCRVRERDEVEVASDVDGSGAAWEERPEVGQKSRPE